jgi:HEAT repeat protein
MKTAEELFLESFEGDYDDEAPWDAVRALRLRNTEDVFQLAVAYCRSETPKQRARALDVLAQLGAGKPLSDRPHFNECVSIATKHLGDADPLVVHSAAWALAHLNDDDHAVTALIEMRHCPDPGVRWAVACGMLGSRRPEAIGTLIELMDDSDDEVRNWATFALGSESTEEDKTGPLSAFDSREVRDALRKRLDDSFSDVRAEAIWGLALRKDPEGLRLLLDRLDAEEWAPGDEMTAGDILDRKSDTPVEDLRAGPRNLLDSK